MASVYTDVDLSPRSSGQPTRGAVRVEMLPGAGGVPAWPEDATLKKIGMGFKEAILDPLPDDGLYTLTIQTLTRDELIAVMDRISPLKKES